MTGDSERGSVSLELAVLAPALLLILALTVAAGRVALASSAIDGVAEAAARQASLARTAEQARTAATTTAERTLAEQDLRCTSTTVDVDTSGFAVPLGRPAAVRVEVICTVALSDLALPGMPGHKTLRDAFTSAIDPFRGRQ